jgi:hypothetical protein
MYIFIGCDPNGGGDSEMCVYSVAMEDNNYVVVGIESHHTKGFADIKNLLTNHVRQLRAIFKSATFVFIPESNLGHEASHMWHMLKDMPRMKVLIERGEPGVITTHKRKELYANFAVEKFAGNCMFFSNDSQFVCMNPFQDANKRGNIVKKKHLQQLAFFNKLVIPRGNPEEGAIPKVVYSGKASGPDDTIMTMVITLYWSMMFMTGRSNPNFKTVHQ